MSQPGKRSLDALAEKLAEPMSQAVTDWYNGSDHSKTSWTAMLRKILQSEFEADLTGPFNNILSNRGIKPGTEQAAAIAVLTALNRTDDIRKKILQAPLVAASPFSIKTLLSKIHQALVTNSLLQHARDLFTRDVTLKDTRLTGRVRWETNSENSRHAELQGREFFLREGTNLNGETIFGPRHDPTNANEWSGCTCNLVYETVSGEWV